MSEIKSGDFYKREGRIDGIPIDPNFLSRLPETGTILDLGCGAGNYARSLADLGYIVYACDPKIGTEKDLPKNKTDEQIGKGKVTFLTATDQSIPDIQFDAIWMRYSLPFVDDINTCLQNLSNHLKTGGVLYTLFFESRDYDNRIISPKNTKTFTPEELASKIERYQLPFKIEYCEVLDRPKPKDGELEPSGVQNKATIMISRKEEVFSKGINLNETGSLKIEKSGWKGNPLPDTSQGLQLI
jgi:SAM-dependent methyltransferase